MEPSDGPAWCRRAARQSALASEPDKSPQPEYTGLHLGLQPGSLEGTATGRQGYATGAMFVSTRSGSFAPVFAAPAFPSTALTFPPQ
jgi:hypothetical protein